jgi:uncharacterized protein YllA (UPF0747 family)
MATKKTTVNLGKKGKITFKAGTFTAQAKAKGMTPAQLQKKVLASPSSFSPTTVKRARLRKTLVGFKKK